MGSTGGTPRSQHIATDSSDMDPAEAQLFAEMGGSRTKTSRSPAKPIHPPTQHPAASLTQPINTTNEYDDGYDTDPPAHYPKAGNGLARTLRPESEDLQWLVDDNFEVFSHGWKGDGSGVGADAGLSGFDGGDMEGVVHGGR
jgi:hypothetical protein